MDIVHVVHNTYMYIYVQYMYTLYAMTLAYLNLLGGGDGGNAGEGDLRLALRVAQRATVWEGGR